MTTYTPVFDQVAQKISTAFVTPHLADDWRNQRCLPVFTTTLGEWYERQADYTRPPGPQVVWPPAKGRGYPRGVRA